MHGPSDGEPREEIGAREMVEDVLDLGNTRKENQNQPKDWQECRRKPEMRTRGSSVKTVIARMQERMG